MTEIPIEDLIKQTGSIFKLVILAGLRTSELTAGYKAKIDTVNKKLSAIALEEIAEGMIEFKIED
ncbi:MAG: DNA-directed RNA polymerase subunit omega [Candidatus Omnitrophica bacterium]|nr:DNA-directed RNA polymerase subunit omega [Candidatus Omnitrophota bacterium]